MTTLKVLAGTLGIAVFAGAAHSAVFVEIVRFSDTKARIIGSGVFDVASDGIVALRNSNSVGQPGPIFEFDEGIFAGPNVMPFAYVRTGTMDLNLDWNGPIAAAVPLTGSVVLELENETWAPAGTTGEAYEFLGDPILGSYEIRTGVIPLPATGLLLIGGIGALAALRRLRRG
jgi:hypothetical protein